MINTPFAVMTVGSETYRLKISAAAAVEAEKKLGCSLARAWGRIDSVNVQVTILWAALQRFHHGTDFDEAMELYDRFIDEGHGQDELADIFMEVYRCSGFMKREVPNRKEIPETTENRL